MENDTPTRTRARTPLDHDPAKLRRRRVEAGFNLTRLARIVSCSPGHLSELENGTRNPSPDLLRRLAIALDSPTAALMPDLPQKTAV